MEDDDRRIKKRYGVCWGWRMRDKKLEGLG